MMKSIYHDNAHFSFYFFDKKLIISTLNNNPKLIDNMWNYLISIDYNDWINNKLTIENLDAKSNFLINYLYQIIYDKEFNTEFILKFGNELLLFCNIPPITIFVEDIPKEYLLLDNKIENPIVIKNIHHLTKNKKLLPFFKDLYLPQFGYYHNKKYAKILQNLFNYPLHDIDLYDEKNLVKSSCFNFINKYQPFTELSKQFELIKYKRTDIEHYLDTLGLCESFNTNYPIFTKKHLTNKIIQTLELIPNYSNDKILFYQNVFDYMFSYIEIEKYHDKRRKNNILHLNNLGFRKETIDYMTKYYKRTIFEHNNPKLIAGILKNYNKEKIELDLLELQNKFEANFFFYINKNISFSNIFAKQSIKTEIDPCLFKYGEYEYQDADKRYNLNYKLTTGLIASIDKLQSYLEKCISFTTRNSFIISDFANFKYEQRCFFRNGRIIGTTPCARKISFLHCYPNGRIHPYFIDHHNADIDDLKLDRKMAAEMAWFIKAAARDYDNLQILDGNRSTSRCGTIDVGYDVDKQEWKIIEIHYFDGDIFQSNAGLYGMNPFLFNNRNIKEVNELNNGTLKINWGKAKTKLAGSNATDQKNALLIDLLEINEPHQIETNDLFVLFGANYLLLNTETFPISIYENNKEKFVGFECDTELFDEFICQSLTLYFIAMIKNKMSRNQINIADIGRLFIVSISNNHVIVQFRNTYININIFSKQKIIIINSTLDNSIKLFKFDRYKLYKQKMFKYLQDLLFSHTLYELNYAHKNKKTAIVIKK